jgi:putative ABC transport system permease protein
MTGLHNIRYSVRQLRRNLGFSITVVAVLALGIGANTAVFSAIDAVLLKPLPFPHGDELVSVQQSMRTEASPNPFVAPVRLEDWNRMNSTFQALAGYDTEDVSETSGELPEKITRAGVSPRFLQVWGVAPILGRDFSPEEEHFGGPVVSLISERLWRNKFQGDQNIIGKKLRYGNASETIVGVMPASSLFPVKNVDVWVPVAPDAPYATDRNSTWYNVVGRLKPGVSLEQARTDLATVQSRLGQQFPKTDGKLTVHISFLKAETIAGAGRSLWTLYGSVTLLLLIACANIAALLMARATDREHDVLVRFSLGASRASLVMQLVTEMFILALIGAIAGIALAAGGTKIFQAFTPDLPRVQEIRVSWRVLSYSTISAFAVTLLCGVLPAFRATRVAIAESLAGATRSQVSSRAPIQWFLVSVQVALSVALLAGAGLLVRSLQELARVSPGFNPNNVLTLHVSAGWGETADMKALAQRINRMLDGLRAIPGVAGAATSEALPGTAGRDRAIELKILEGGNDPSRKIVADARFVSTGYFGVAQIPVLAGEPCRNQSNSLDVVVNRSFANTYFVSGNPIGHHLSNTALPNFALQGEVRGIVADAREEAINTEPVPTVYWCMNNPVPDPYYLVRTRGEPLAMINTIRRTIRQLEPNRSVFDIEPLADRLSDSFAEDRMRTSLLSAFALAALALAGVGIYGTLSYVVSLRRREIGLRLALGALRRQIVLVFLAQGLRAVGLGCVFGLGLAMASTRILSGMLYGVSNFDTQMFAAVMLVLLALAMFSTLFPAIRAARIDPMQVLRDE